MYYNNSNEMVRGYFVRDSEGGYAPKNYKVNTRGGGNNLMNNYMKLQKPTYNNYKKLQKDIKNKRKKNQQFKFVEAMHNPSIMMQKPYTKKKK